MKSRVTNNPFEVIDEQDPNPLRYFRQSNYLVELCETNGNPLNERIPGYYETVGRLFDRVTWIDLVGTSNSGKTTLLEGLVEHYAGIFPLVAFPELRNPVIYVPENLTHFHQTFYNLDRSPWQNEIFVHNVDRLGVVHSSPYLDPLRNQSQIRNILNIHERIQNPKKKNKEKKREVKLTGIHKNNIDPVNIGPRTPIEAYLRNIEKLLIAEGNLNVLIAFMQAYIQSGITLPVLCLSERQAFDVKAIIFVLNEVIEKYTSLDLSKSFNTFNDLYKVEQRIQELVPYYTAIFNVTGNFQESSYRRWLTKSSFQGTWVDSTTWPHQLQGYAMLDEVLANTYYPSCGTGHYHISGGSKEEKLDYAISKIDEAMIIATNTENYDWVVFV